MPDVRGEIASAQAADAVLDAIRSERFHIPTHERIAPAIHARMEDLRGERDPLAL